MTDADAMAASYGLTKGCRIEAFTKSPTLTIPYFVESWAKHPTRAGLILEVRKVKLDGTPYRTTKQLDPRWGFEVVK